jgi:hypothetical protein
VERARQQRRLAQGRRLAQLQGGTFGDLDDIIGFEGGAISGTRGNASVFRNGRLATAAELAGQQDQLIGGDDRTAIEQFFNPSLLAGQQKRLEALAKRAAAQGLSGGAPSGQLQDLGSRFLATNRAGAFGRVRDIINLRLQQTRNDVTPFFQQFGALNRPAPGGVQQLQSELAGRGPGGFSLTAVNEASGLTQHQFRNFASVGLRALSGIGFGGDAIAGLARRQGVNIDQTGTTGAHDIGDAFSRFLKPTDDFARPGLDAINRATPLGIKGGIDQFNAGFTLHRRSAKGAERLIAGKHLAGRIGEVFQRLNTEAHEFSTLGAAANSFQQFGGQGAANRLANLDFSRFQGIAERFGIGQGVRSGGSQAGFFNQAGSSGNLFRTVFGVG